MRENIWLKHIQIQSWAVGRHIISHCLTRVIEVTKHKENGDAVDFRSVIHLPQNVAGAGPLLSVQVQRVLIA